MTVLTNDQLTINHGITGNLTKSPRDKRLALWQESKSDKFTDNFTDKSLAMTLGQSLALTLAQTGCWRETKTPLLLQESPTHPVSPWHRRGKSGKTRNSTAESQSTQPTTGCLEVSESWTRGLIIPMIPWILPWIILLMIAIDRSDDVLMTKT